MKRPREPVRGAKALDLIEETVHLLRGAPSRVLVSYYLGSLPFVLGLLYFWADMCLNAVAYSRCPQAALGLTLLYLWMKCWQAVFAAQIKAQIRSERPPSWSLGRIGRLILTQTAIQPTSLFLLLVAAVITLPFAWVSAFYHNVSGLGDGEKENVKSVFTQAVRQAMLWPSQNHMLILVLYGFGFFVFVNVAIAAIMLPALLRTFFGLETVFTLSGAHAFNTTFLAAVCGITYLCINPMIKTAYVLRCFYGASVHTGEDLTVELRNLVRAPRVATAIIATIWLCAFSTCECRAERVDSMVRIESIRSAAPKGRDSTAQGNALGIEIAQSVKPCKGDIECPTRPECMPPFQGSIEWFAGIPRALPWAMLSDPFGVEAKNNIAVIGSSPAKHMCVGVFESRPLSALGSSSLATSDTPKPASPAPAVSAPELDRSIDEVLKEREYVWRMPRQADTDKKGVVGSFLDGVVNSLRESMRTARAWMNKLRDWWRDLFGDGQRRESSGGLLGSVTTSQGLLFVLIAAVVCTLVILVWRMWKQRGLGAATVAEPISMLPDLGDESVVADQLPVDGWLARARELMSKGDLRMALRALYLASLAHLGQREMIRIAKFKSNREYEIELRRRAHAHPRLLDAFAQNVSVFERVWYGMYDVNDQMVNEFNANFERIRRRRAGQDE